MHKKRSANEMPFKSRGRVSARNVICFQRTIPSAITHQSRSSAPSDLIHDGVVNREALGSATRQLGNHNPQLEATGLTHAQKVGDTLSTGFA